MKTSLETFAIRTLALSVIAGAAMSVLADDPRAFYPAQLVKT